MKKRSKVLLAVVTAILVATLALTVGVLASDNTPTLEINGANVSFESTVHLFYSVGYDNVDAPADIELLVWKEYEGIHVDKLVSGTEDARLSSGGDVNEGTVQGRYFEYDGLSAAEMTTNVYARAYTVIDGEEVYSPVVKYSILNYALNMLGVTGKGTETVSLRNMLTAMLEYGATAQLHFAPESTAPLANEDFVKITLTGTTFADGTTKSLVRVGDKVTLTAPTTEALPYVRWTNADGKLLSARNEYVLTAKNNIAVSATLTNEASSFGAYDHVVVIGVDGAGTFRTFCQIILPLSVSMMITVFLFSFSWQWTDTFYTNLFYVTDGPRLFTREFLGIPTSLKLDEVGKELYETAIKNTCGIMIILPLVVVYLFLQRFLVQGIERSGISAA